MDLSDTDDISDDTFNVTIHGHDGDETEDNEHGTDSTAPSGYKMHCVYR